MCLLNTYQTSDIQFKWNLQKTVKANSETWDYNTNSLRWNLLRCRLIFRRVISLNSFDSEWSFSGQFLFRTVTFRKVFIPNGHFLNGFLFWMVIFWTVFISNGHSLNGFFFIPNGHFLKGFYSEWSFSERFLYRKVILWTVCIPKGHSSDTQVYGKWKIDIFDSFLL